MLAEVFRQVDPSVQVDLKAADGAAFDAGDVLAVLSGNARAILLGERVALNLLQRLSGIATQTAAFVAEAAGTGARWWTRARPRRGCGRWSATRCAAAAGTTTAIRSPTR